MAALHAFERVAALQSFRRAADDLALTASAVSHQISGLEDHFGVRLFDRNSRPLSLTVEGQRYLVAVASGLKTLDDASREMLRQGRGRPTGLNVSAVAFFTQTMIIPTLADFQARHPGIPIQIDSSPAYADMAGRSVDVAIRLGREHSAGLRFEPLIEVYRMPVASRALVALVLKSPADLAKLKLIHLKCLPDAWPIWLEAAGLSLPANAAGIWVECGTAALEAAEYGLGVTLPQFPLAQRRRGFEDALVVPFDIASLPSTYYFITRREHTHDRRVAAFRNWLFAAAEDLVRETSLRAAA